MSHMVSGEVSIGESKSLVDIILGIVPSNPIKAFADGEMLQIIFFDDSPAAIESFIPLTSIKQDVNKITQNTLSILTEGIKINRKNKKGCLRVNKHVVIDPTIVKRESTL